MYKQKELITINESDSMDKQCQDIITNWEIVCEENDYHKDYVTSTQWEQWLGKREEVDKKIISLSTSQLGEIYDYLISLNNQINRAKRVDFTPDNQQQEDEESLLKNSRQVERNSQPSKGLLDKMMFWR